MKNFWEIIKGLFSKKSKVSCITFHIVEPVKNKPLEFDVTTIETTCPVNYKWTTVNATSFYLYVPSKTTTRYKKEKRSKNVRK